MKIERTKNSIRSTASGLFNRCINLLIPFVIRTIMIRKLGSEYLGLNSLFTSIVQVLNLTELGVGSALVFNMYKPIVEDDISALSGLLQLYKNIYRAIGGIILVAGLCTIPALPYLVDTSQLEGTGINLYILFLIYLANTAISYFFFAYRKSLLMAHQRQDVISNINSAVHFLLYALQIAVLFIVPNYYVYIILMPVFTIADNLVVAYITRKYYAHIIQYKDSKIVHARSILSSVKYVVGHKVGAVVIQSADSIIISMFLNLTTLTIYGNYYYVISAINGFINVGYNAILAGVGNSIITQSKERMYRLFKDLSYMIFYVVTFCATCMLTLYQPFMEIWMGPEFMFPMHTVILFVVYFYTWQVRVIGLNFKDAAGMWKNDFLKPYVGLVVNVLLNILLINVWGVDGVLIATIVVMVLVYFPWEAVVLHRDLFQTGMAGYVIRNVRYAVTAVLCAALTYFVVDKIHLSGMAGLCVKAAVTVVLCNLILIISSLKLREAQRMFERVKRLCTKRK